MKLDQKSKVKSHLAPLVGPRPLSISCCLVTAALTAAPAAAPAAVPAAAPAATPTAALAAAPAFDFWLLVQYYDAF
jgi:hypothetical protein